MSTSGLVGKWNLESSENMNDFLKQLGMSLSKRRVEVNVKPSMIISCNGDVWSIVIDMKNKGTETIFTEGTEIDTSNELKFVFDNRFYFESRRFCKSTFKFDSPNKLVQQMKFTDTEEKQLIIRELDEQTGNLVETCEMNGVKATKIYSKC